MQKNTEIFTDAFRMVDGHLHVLQRIMNDFSLGQAYQLSTGGLDYSAYLSEYWATMGFIDFVIAMKEATQSVAPIVESATEEETIVFGE